MNGKYALTMHNNQKYTLVLYYITLQHDELATYIHLMSVSSYVDEESRDSKEQYYTNFHLSTVLFLKLIRQCFNWTSSLSALAL